LLHPVIFGSTIPDMELEMDLGGSEVQSWEYALLTNDRLKGSDGKYAWFLKFSSPAGQREMDGGHLRALNELGVEGWELVASNVNFVHDTASGTPVAGDLEAESVAFYFKRPLDASNEPI